jgi:tripartite-type tricarboxylate transporter receptor subunit TctC
MDIFPDTPTAREQGYDIVVNTFRGLGGPAGIPEDRVAILHEGFKKMMEEPDFVKVISNMGLGIDYRNTADYYKLTEETAKTLAPVLESLLAIK